MKIRLRHTLVAVGLAGALVFGGAAIASAATGSSPPTMTPSTGAGSAPKSTPTGSSAQTPQDPGTSTHCSHMGNGSPPES
jgi:hypothetical protein